MPEGTLDLVVDDEKTWSDLVRDLLDGEDAVTDLTACNSSCAGDPGCENSSDCATGCDACCAGSTGCAGEC